MKTLLITAAASAAAAYTCSKIWVPGTLAAAAFTPVLVAIIKEALAKSTDVVVRAVPIRGVVRSARAGEPEPLDGGAQAPGGDFPDQRTIAPTLPSQLPEDVAQPEMRVAQAGEIQYHGASRRRRGWRVAIVTGLLGFLIAAVIFTVPELVAGGSAAGGGRDTTLFGGGHHARSAPAVTTTETTTTPTQTQTVTAPPVKTVTVAPPVVTSTTPPATTPPPVAPGAAPSTVTNPAAPAVTTPSTTQPPS